METISFSITGVEPLLLNNPQSIDPFNHYAKAKKKITDKRKKTEEDQLELRRLDIASKTYFDPELGVYIPTTWITAAIAGNAWVRAKISKAQIRASVFPTAPGGKIKLHYEGEQQVKELADIADNPKFSTVLLLKQGQVKIPKAIPIFHKWSFTAELDFDPTIIDRDTLVSILDYVSSYGGFGDFRPTYGRSQFKELNGEVKD